MTRLRYSALLMLGAAAACLSGISARAQQFRESPAPPTQWTPLVARFVERDQTWTKLGMPETLEFSGNYFRDRFGSWYRRMRIASHLNLLRVVGGTDSALLYDRPNHMMYTLDFTRGTVHRQSVDVSALPDFGPAPMSPQAFLLSHSQDRALGKKKIAGLECEGYALRDERRKNKYVAEMWYAPSLAYLAVAAKTHFKGDQDVTTMLENIQPGKDPDPQFFTVPVSLTLVK